MDRLGQENVRVTTREVGASHSCWYDEPMHERSMVQSLLRLMGEHLGSLSLSRVRAVHVTIGEFSGIERTLFEIAFYEMMRERGNDDLELCVNVVPLRARCKSCGHPFIVEAFNFMCPICLEWQVEVIAGEEFMLDRLEVDS